MLECLQNKEYVDSNDEQLILDEDLEVKINDKGSGTVGSGIGIKQE
jgi:hypothetical protein